MKVVIIALILLVFASADAICYQITASASLKSSRGSSYKSENLADSDISTAWCAKSNTDKLRLSIRKDGHSKGRLGIYNGYSKNNSTYLNNARVKELITKSQNKETSIVLEDVPYFQVVDVGDYEELSITIVSFYQGKKYDDVCLSDIVINDEIISGVVSVTELLSIKRTLNDKDIKELIGQFYLKYKSNLTKILDLSLAWKEESGLRLLLNLMHYNRQYRKTIDAELLEYLSDKAQTYFVNSNNIIEKVLIDKKQKGQDEITKSFYNYIDGMDLDHAKNDNTSNLKRLKVIIDRYEKSNNR